MIYFSKALNLLPLGALILLASPSYALETRKGQDAYGDWRQDKPGVRRLITPADLPAPHATTSSTNGPRVVSKPADSHLQLPDGFSIEPLVKGLKEPRQMKKAPNGDIFIAESGGLAIRVLPHASMNQPNPATEVFADGFESRPYGIAFYPDDENPRYLYVGVDNKVIRFAYQNGDLKARSLPETIIPNLPAGGHSTRDVAFSRDGKHMLIAVGSGSNTAEGGMASEKYRANILECTPEGGTLNVYASGLRNPVTMAFQPATDTLWTTVNERDGLGDNLPPDYVTSVKRGGDYGWPFYYIGGNEDPRYAGKYPERKNQIIAPDVLLQPHSAPLGLVFYTGKQFPKEYNNTLFVASHGSWNRSKRTGYKIVRALFNKGKPTGEYEDFLTGFVTPEGNVWGRPVGLAVDNDGALLMSDDASGTIWRIRYAQAPQ